MILLLAAVALAQDPQEFLEFPADVVVEGNSFSGILIDEATYSELIELRVAVATKDAEIASFAEWRESQTVLFDTSLTHVQHACEEGQNKLVAHYEKSLERERKKDWMQRHSFPVGVALGVVGATAAYLGAVHLYGQVL